VHVDIDPEISHLRVGGGGDHRTLWGSPT